MAYTYLQIDSGPRAGNTFPLDPAQENRIGRGIDCHVVLADPLSSRVHALIVYENDAWWLRDAGSRNGCYVNQQKVDEARLIEGCSLRLGASEFTFHDLPDEEDLTASGRQKATLTLVRDEEFDSDKVVPFALPIDERTQDLLVLYQLAIKLLGCHNPDEVVRISLDLLHDRVAADVVGFLWLGDEGQLKPKLVLPTNAGAKVKLSEPLTAKVCKEGHAIWVGDQPDDKLTRLNHYTDAICVPLRRDKETLGAVHLYREAQRFRQSDYEVSLSLANILAVALARAREETCLRVEHQQLVAKSANSGELIGSSPPMIALQSKLTKVARATGCVLVRGESGAGKELVARAVHRASPRADRPMLSVNCAAIPRDLMESQLFGHRKGAFTGADQDHVGWFQQADSGTLFLDEIGEMTLEGQAKLLRILEGYPFLPVGATKEVTVDVRVIAATNRDLREFVRDGKFREDLYYRLSVFELYLPPLRERGPDIELLIDHFLQHFRMQHGRPTLRLSEEARRRLVGYHWPGNVRQLRNVIDSAVVLAEGDEILPDDLGLRDVSAQAGGELESLRMDFWERKLIREALGRTNKNVPEAAKLLGIGRATLYRKLEEYGIER